MTTTKQNNEKTSSRPSVSSKTLSEGSQNIDQSPMPDEIVPVSCLAKNKKIRPRLLTSVPGNARSSQTYQEKKSKENKRGSRSKVKVQTLEAQRKRRLRQQQSSLRRRLWTTEEDKAISSLVRHYGIRRWTLISRKLQDKYHIYGRSGKQCRERFDYFSYE